jgi:hypothetical protein
MKNLGVYVWLRLWLCRLLNIRFKVWWDGDCDPIDLPLEFTIGVIFVEEDLENKAGGSGKRRQLLWVKLGEEGRTKVNF